MAIGVWLHLNEKQTHLHQHEPMEHEHVHDERTTRSGPRSYLQLFEGFREEGVVRLRIVANLGRAGSRS
jgi:hypothetical protein